MRICLISDIPPYVTGGAEQQSWLLAKAWANQGHTVEIFGHRIPHNTQPSSKIDQKIKLRSINVVYSLGRLLRALTYFFSLSILLLIHKKRFDIIYCRFLGEAALSILLLKKLNLIKIPLVCVPAAAGKVENADLALIKSLPFSSQLVTLINSKCDCINYIAPNIEDSMIQEGIKTKYISRIPNGVAIPTLRDTEDFKNPSKLLFVGRLSKQKGLDILLPALSRLTTQGLNFSCRIIGDGTELEALKKVVMQLHLSEQITFVGKLTNEEVRAEMVQSHYLILPSRYEGMSNAALEALACGLPCILTRCGGIDAYLPSGTALLCEPENLTSLQQALENALTTDINTWKKMSTDSKQFIVDTFSIETIAQRNIELFKSIR